MRMRPRIFISYLVSVVTVVCVISHAVASECDSVLRLSSHNVKKLNYKRDVGALVSSNYCNKEFSSLSKGELAAIEVLIFGYGGGGAGGQRTELQSRLKDWCQASRSSKASNEDIESESRDIFDVAVKAWETCVELQSKKVLIVPTIAPDYRSVNIGITYHGNTESGVKLYGIHHDGFDCNVAPNSSKFPMEIRNESIKVFCRRNKPELVERDGQKYERLSSGVIAIQTADDNPFQLFFAEEWNPEIPAQEAKAIRLEMKQAELPVGTLILSVLQPEEFMSSRNPMYSPGKWVVADGKELPEGTLYEKITNKRVAPDLRSDQSALNILDVVTVPRRHADNVQSAITESGRHGEWKWFVSGRDIKGNRVTGDMQNDYEQAEDHFQTFVDDNGAIIARGTTYNYKYNKWGEWLPGEANLLGISFARKSYYYYVKVN